MEQVAVVTGASRGIGAQVALLAASRGYAVAVNFTADAAAADRVVAEIERAGGRALAVQANVAEEADVLRLFETVDAKLGTITALVNNAGVLDTVCKVRDMTLARLDRVFAINVIGSFLCAREAIRRMSTKTGGAGGAIVNVSSGAAKGGAPGQFVDYAATKGAVETFTIGLSKEVAGEGIRVNAVRPGVIDTEIHARGGQPGKIDQLKSAIPMQRAGHAIEVANAILWLMSAEASYVTGALVDVSGGR
jgi:NAD(P)-dependent dehydrogenase (short-subunit alcohol dehydrogenase family)